MDAGSQSRQEILTIKIMDNELPESDARVRGQSYNMQGIIGARGIAPDGIKPELVTLE